MRALASVLTTDVQALLTHRVTEALHERMPDVDSSNCNLHWLHRGLSMFEERVLRRQARAVSATC